MTDAPKELHFYDDWLAQHTKGKLLCGNNKYLHESHVDALLKAEREKALREAARYLQSQCNCSQVTCMAEETCNMDRQRAREILALIEKGGEG